MSAPRIMLMHALQESMRPAHEAFAAAWSEAECFDVLDSSLSADLASCGRLEGEIIERVMTLAHYAARASGREKAAALLFTCSAFGRAIEAVKGALAIPVLRPNEAAFDEALDRGTRIGLIVTFRPSLAALEDELMQMAAQRGVQISVPSRVVPGALESLRDGDGARHDALVVAAAVDMPPVDCLVLGQFSTARAAPAVERIAGVRPITTPHSAVRKLRSLIQDRARSASL